MAVITSPDGFPFVGFISFITRSILGEIESKSFNLSMPSPRGVEFFGLILLKWYLEIETEGRVSMQDSTNRIRKTCNEIMTLASFGFETTN